MGKIAFGHRMFCIRQTNARRLLFRGYFAENGIDAGVGAEAESVLVAEGRRIKILT